MLVMKFGGTSVADAERVRAVVEIVRGRSARKPVVVVSAQGGVTNQLIQMARDAVSGNTGARPLRDRLKKLVAELSLPAELLEDEIEELRALLKGVSLVGDLSPRSLDRMMSFGERCSARVVAAALDAAGVPASACMAYDLGLVTDPRYGRASVLDPSYERLGRAVREVVDGGRVPVITGFIAKDEQGFITTLGRGGSDYTAAIVGRAVAADEIEIWTDVSGVMTADPRIVPGARSLECMSFAEMAELAYYGAKVIHPATLQPAIKADIPIRVLNTYNVESRGTVILRDPPGGGRGLCSIASKAGITLVHVNSLRMLLMPGFMARLFAAFERHGVVIDMISTSEVSVTLTTDDPSDLDQVAEELRAFAEVSVEPDKAILCLVGEGLRDQPDLLARLFDTLRVEGIPVRMVSVGASRINVSLLVDLDDESRAVQALHAEFLSSEA